MRQGAYRESLRAVELTREVGMKSGCNLFITKENIWQFDRLVADLQHAGMQEIIPCLYSFTPNARGRHTEALRPEWRDVEPLVREAGRYPGGLPLATFLARGASEAHRVLVRTAGVSGDLA